MLYGRFEHSLDSKGRMRIPSDFKKDLGSDGYVFFAPSNGVVSIYSKEGIKQKLAFADSLSPFNKAEMKAAKLVFGSIYDISVDGQGRLLVPVVVRNKLRKIESVDESGNKTIAEINIKELVSVGMGDHIDLMTKEYEAKQDEETSEEDAMALLDMLFKKKSDNNEI